MSQVRLTQTTGPATSAGAALASPNPTETGTWTEVAGVTAAIPSGGALLTVTANTAPIRVAVISNGTAAPPTPPHNGHPLALGAVYSEVISPGTRVFTRTL